MSDMGRPEILQAMNDSSWFNIRFLSNETIGEVKDEKDKKSLKKGERKKENGSDSKEKEKEKATEEKANSEETKVWTGYATFIYCWVLHIMSFEVLFGRFKVIIPSFIMLVPRINIHFYARRLELHFSEVTTAKFNFDVLSSLGEEYKVVHKMEENCEMAAKFYVICIFV
jgi:hypothetical protein